MKLFTSFVQLFILFSLSQVAWGLPLDDLPQKNLSVDSKALNNVSDKSLFKEEKSLPSVDNKTLSKKTIIPGSSQQYLNTDSSNAQQKKSVEYQLSLFDDQELETKNSMQELYEVFSTNSSSEVKNSAKRILLETSELREILNISSKASDSNDGLMQKSNKNLELVNGKTLEEMSNSKLPTGVGDTQGVDKMTVRALFDDFYELLRNAFFIIVGIIILAKVTSFIVKKILSDSEKHRKRKGRRRRKRRRRRTFASYKTG